MVALTHVTVEADAPGGDFFYREALGIGDAVRVRAATSESSGFRGFLLGLILGQPADVDLVMENARRAGAQDVKAASASLWGYGGVIQAPDGAIVTLASSSKKNRSSAGTSVESVVVQLGVDDVAASTHFYSERGFVVSKRFGRRYAEFDSGPIAFTLNRRADLAKTAGVPDAGTGSHRLELNGDAEPFTDPDGYVWTRPGF